MPLEWKRLPPSEEEDLIVWQGTSPELDYENFAFLLPVTPHDLELAIRQGLGLECPEDKKSWEVHRTYPEGKELWQYQINFFDADGERPEGFPMLMLWNYAPLELAQEICERYHQDAIAWAEAHPEWRRAKEQMNEVEWVARLFKPMQALWEPEERPRPGQTPGILSRLFRRRE